MSKQFLVSTLGNQITSNFRRIPKWVYIVILLITITILIILLFRDANPSVEVAAPALVVIETVEKGEVSTGISASGTIIAQEKLNLNIYRQQHRIEYVGISSGAQVQKGQLLFSFDDDDISLRRREFELARNTAVLELKEIQETSADPSSMIPDSLLRSHLAELSRPARTCRGQYVNRAIDGHVGRPPWNDWHEH